MKRLRSPSGLFLLALSLVVVANGFVLSGVALNRSGPPEAQVVLSERELTLPYRLHEENSGLALRLVWRVLGVDDDRNRWRSSPAWLTPAKLQALGFDLPDAPEAAAKDAVLRAPLPREVCIVLEQNGPLYQKSLQRAAAALEAARRLNQAHPENDALRKEFEEARKRFQHEQIAASRLFAVDAGTAPEALRRAYPDRRRFIIAKGLVKAGYAYEEGRRRVSGTISRLVIERIHVPLALRGPLDTILKGDRFQEKEPAPPRYEIALAYGRRFEPWIVSVTPTPRQQSPAGN
jgi:hypothetical protein